MSNSAQSNATPPSRWLLRSAQIMTLMTFPLIWVGGLVTTYDAGMAVPDWPNTFGYNLLLYPLSTWVAGPFDLFVEHGHRLLAVVVGLLAIALVVAAHRWEDRPWMKRWSWFVLMAVIAQGILGGLRVLMDERTMAMIHGCTGPLFFALATATTVMMTSWWRNAIPNDSLPSSLRVLIVFLAIAAICQLVIGAQLRHIQVWAKPVFFTSLVHLHLTFAGLLTLLVLVVGWIVARQPRSSVVGLRNPSRLLVVLIVLQLQLGIATWLFNYALPWQELNVWLAHYRIDARGWMESLTITGHQAMGSLILACVTVLLVSVLRLTRTDSGN